MKQTSFNVRIPAFFLAISFMLTACSSSTTIISSPENSKLYIDGKFVGHTPYRHSDSKIMGKSTMVQIEKEGYRTLYTSFRKIERFDAGAFLGGIFLVVPYLWSLKYKSSHQYELIPLGKNETAVPSGNNQSPDKISRTQPTEVELSGSATQKLRRLKEMFDKGLITKEKYDAQRAKILENL